MTPERWARVTELFDAATGLPANARMAWLDASGADAELAAEVRAMLDAYDTDPGYLEQPLGAVGALDAVTPDGLVGRRLGAWRLVRKVGQGGMGVVYEAARDDEAFDRRAAVKLLPVWSAGALAARFRFERRVLATLDHPGIARLIDAGSADDRVPYCVMEFVDGAPIDGWCRARSLGLADRIALFVRVCDAVAYAHQHLVVHRDLKPANILVGADGQPKLLDFGIATLLSEEGGVAIGTTRTGHASFTPEFASPEQVRGDKVTTASDIYSLGVLLYVLLTDRRPYDLAGVAPLEAMRVICEVEPPRPSSVVEPSLAGAVKGDLDNIVARALRKAPAERYATVAALTDDLRAWRGGRPVSAVPASIAYVARRFIRRHRLAVTAAAAVTLAVVGGGAVAVWQARIAREEKARAEARFNDVRALANAVVGPLYDAIAEVPGTTSARQVLVTEALAYLDRLAALSADDIDLKAELADAYQKIGGVQGNHLEANLGNVQAASASYAKLLDLRRAVFAARPDDASRRALARAELLTGDIALGESRLAEAVERYDRVLDLVGPPTAAGADEATVLMAARAHGRAGVALGWAGKTADAETRFDRAIAMLEPRATRPDAPPEVHQALAATLSNSGDIYYYAEQFDQALRRFEKALGLARQPPAGTAGSAAGRSLSLALIRTAAALKEVRRLDDAATLEHEAIALLESQMAADPNDVALRFDLASTRQNLAITHMRRGELAPARREAADALALFESTMAASPGSRQFLFDFAATWTTLGQIELAAGRFAVSADAFRKSVELFRDPLVAERKQSERLLAYEGLGDALTGLADAASRREAVVAYTTAHDGFAALAAASTAPTSVVGKAAEVAAKLARVRKDPS